MTLEKILKQDLIVAKESQKLADIKKEYTRINRKYPNNYFVVFDDYGTQKIGRIQGASFESHSDDVGIRYCLHVVTKGGEYSNRDKAFYYVFEKNLSPYPVLNAMYNQ